MLRSPQLYGVPLGAVEDDPLLLQQRLDLAHSAALLLDKHSLIRCVLGVRLFMWRCACVSAAPPLRQRLAVACC
jgi:hypothetical protein